MNTPAITPLNLRSLTVDQVRHGLPASLIDDATFSGLDRGAVLRLVGAPSTLRKRISAKASLTPVESDRLMRLARVVAHANDVFGSEEKAKRWLTRPSGAREDRSSPIDLLDTDLGTQWVEQRLFQIEYGIYA